MKLIYEDLITAVSSSTEDSDWPDDNVSDDFQINVWKATTNTATLTLTVNSLSNSLALHNINADYVSIAVKNTAETETYYTSETVNLGGVVDLLEFMTWEPDLTSIMPRNAWFEYPKQYANHKIIVSFGLTDTSDVVQCGIARAGVRFEIENPAYGINETLVDKSPVKVLNDGSIYYKKLTIFRHISFEILVERERKFYAFQNYLIRNVFGSQPVSWFITDKETDSDWVVFGRLIQMPASKHETNKHTRMSLTIQEA